MRQGSKEQVSENPSSMHKVPSGVPIVDLVRLHKEELQNSEKLTLVMNSGTGFGSRYERNSGIGDN